MPLLDPLTTVAAAREAPVSACNGGQAEAATRGGLRRASLIGDEARCGRGGGGVAQGPEGGEGQARCDCRGARAWPCQVRHRHGPPSPVTEKGKCSPPAETQYERSVGVA
jgi:hypothetical protein